MSVDQVALDRLCSAVAAAHDPVARFAAAAAAAWASASSSPGWNLTGECLPAGGARLVVMNTATGQRYPVDMGREAARSLAAWLRTAAA